MKKTALAIMLGALAFATSASANWYVEGDVGYSKLKTSGLEGSQISGSSFSPSVSAGYKVNDWRFAVDYTNYGKADYSYANDDGLTKVAGKGDLKAHGFGVSAYYDINTGFDVKPYVGARIATNYIALKETNLSVTNGNTTYGAESDKSTKVGYGVVAGATYGFAPNWDVNGAVEYNRLGKFEDVKVNQYGAKVGIRYNF